MRETTVRCSSEVNRFGLDTSYGMYVILSLYQDKGEAAYSIPLGTRVVNSLMHVIRTIQMLLNSSCFPKLVSSSSLLTSLACQCKRTVGTVMETE